MTIKELLQEQREYLDHFFTHFPVKEAEELLKTFAECEGLIFFTGVGKSGIIAKKIAVTMTSTGTRALYISPTNALHGDIGMLNDKDIFVILSKSGESDELLNLIPYLRNKGAKIISITCQQNSRLGKACDSDITLPFQDELGPLGLTPTTSTTSQILFGDLLTVSLMMEKKFHLEQYQMNHPAGKIGKRLLLKVEDLMITGEGIPLCSPDATLGDVLVELSDKKCGCLMVVDDKRKLLGIFTDGDLRRTLQKFGPQALEKQMKELKIETTRTITADVLAIEAMNQMESNQKQPITVLPVIDSGTQTVVGIIKMHDILQSGL